MKTYNNVTSDNIDFRQRIKFLILVEAGPEDWTIADLHLIP